MASETDIVACQRRVTELRKSVQELERRRSALLGRAEAGRERLVALTAEIRDRGYDPDRLAAIRDEKMTILQGKLTILEQNAREAEIEISRIEEGGA